MLLPLRNLISQLNTMRSPTQVIPLELWSVTITSRTCCSSNAENRLNEDIDDPFFQNPRHIKFDILAEKI
jgi:hypothetical protein